MFVFIKSFGVRGNAVMCHLAPFPLSQDSRGSGHSDQWFRTFCCKPILAPTNVISCGPRAVLYHLVRKGFAAESTPGLFHKLHSSINANVPSLSSWRRQLRADPRNRNRAANFLGLQDQQLTECDYFESASNDRLDWALLSCCNKNECHQQNTAISQKHIILWEFS